MTMITDAGIMNHNSRLTGQLTAVIPHVSWTPDPQSYQRTSVDAVVTLRFYHHRSSSATTFTL